jgi:hypothetical protein
MGADCKSADLETALSFEVERRGLLVWINALRTHGTVEKAFEESV